MIGCKPFSKTDETFKVNQLNEQGKNDIALFKINKLIEKIGEKDDYLFYLRAKIQFDLKNLDDAVQDLNTAIKINSKAPEYYFLLARINQINFTLEKSCEYYLKCLDLDSLSTNTMNQLANNYYMLRKFDLAMKYSNKAINLNENESDYYNIRGLIFAGLNANEQALVDYNKSIALNGRNPLSYYNPSITFLKTGKINQALEDLDKAIAIDSSDGSFFCNRGIAYNLLNKPNLAELDWQRGVELGDSSSERYLMEFDSVKKTIGIKM